MLVDYTMGGMKAVQVTLEQKELKHSGTKIVNHYGRERVEVIF